MHSTAKSPSSLSAQKRKLLEAMLKKRGVALQPKPRNRLAKRQSDAAIPLAFNQHGLWFLDRMDQGKANYNVPGTIRMRGNLNVPAFEKALAEIVRRHEALRTLFVAASDGEPLQKVVPEWPVELEFTDLSTLDRASRENRARELATESARHVFDLANGPLWRFALLRLAADDHLFCLNFHHIIADGWAMGVFGNELKLLYEAAVAGKPAALSELAIQFGDFAIWQRGEIEGESGRKSLAFWRRHFAGALPILNLPFDHHRPHKQSFRGGHAAIQLSGHMSETIRQLARREGASPYMLLLSSFYALLHFYSKQEDIIIGSTFANRQHADLEKLIGYFANTLPIRVSLQGNPRFSELLRRVRDTVLQTSAQQHMPLAKLVQELQPQRVPGRNPFYDVVFDLLTPDRNPAIFGYGLSSTVRESMEMAGVKMTPMDIEGGNARFDLAVFIWDQPHGFAGTFEYSRDLFEQHTVEKMVEAFIALLKIVVAQPEITLHALTEKLAAHARQKQDMLEKAIKSSLREKLKMTKRRAVQV